MKKMFLEPELDMIKWDGEITTAQTMSNYEDQDSEDPFGSGE